MRAVLGPCNEYDKVLLQAEDDEVDESDVGDQETDADKDSTDREEL